MVISLSYPPLISLHTKSLPDRGVSVLMCLLKQLSTYQGHPATRDTLTSVVNRSACFITAVADHEEQGGHFVGIIRIETHLGSDGQRYGELHDEIVAGAFRHNGIGKALIREALAQARRLRVVELSLQVKPYRKEAIALYERFGFKLVSTADPNVVGSANHYCLKL